MLNKKGAIELSMTTIIVIVIGVTLLILGLIFVRTTFGGLQDISDETLGKAKSLLGKGLEDADEFLTLSPESISIEQGKDEAVTVLLFNEGENEITIRATASPSKASDSKLKCLFADTFEPKSKAYTLSSGDTDKVVLLVKDLEGSLRTTGCNVVVNGGPTSGNSRQLLVRVIKN